jgi:3-oxoacyl-[acyl-carrier protein] reductase
MSRKMTLPWQPCFGQNGKANRTAIGTSVMTIKPELHGHTALVTGASRGIGAAIATALAAAGAAVAVNYRQHADQADAVVAKISEAGGRAIAVAADVSQATAVAEMVDRVTSVLGPIDILINNAGMALVRGIDDLTESEFDRTIAVNLKSAFLCTQAVLPSMRSKKWGRIVNISSEPRAAPAPSVFTTTPRRPAWRG